MVFSSLIRIAALIDFLQYCWRIICLQGIFLSLLLPESQNLQQLLYTLKTKTMGLVNLLALIGPVIMGFNPPCPPLYQR